MAHIDTLALLKTHFAAGGSHTIGANTDVDSGGVYTLDADLTASTDLTLVPTENVVIDGAETYKVLFKDATFQIGKTDGTFKMRFQHCDSTEVSAESADTVYNSYYCEYDESIANGFNVTDGNGFGIKVCNYYCQANDNAKDGFSMLGTGGSTEGVSNLLLVDCVGNNNGTAGNNNQGLTAHKSFQLAKAVRSEFAGNGGQGIAVVGGSTIIADRCTFDGNSQGGTIAQVTIEEGVGYFDNCLWKNTKAGTNGVTVSVGASLYIDGSRFIGDEYASHAIYIGSGALFLSVSRTTFSGYTGLNVYAISGAFTSGFFMLLDGNVFYNCNRFVSIQNLRKVRIRNNVFVGAIKYAFVGSANLYSYEMGLTGHNLFYGNAADFYPSDYYSPVDSDLTAVDPRLNSDIVPQSAALYQKGTPCALNESGDVLLRNSLGTYGIPATYGAGGRLFRGLL